jgi:hypothetical protein
VKWLRIVGFEGEDLGKQEEEKLIIMLHALANRQVGFLVRILRWALANRRTSGINTVGLFPLPNASTIPFTSFLVPPVPFTSESLEWFSRCHISTMTEPSFFVDDEWTGYVIYQHEDIYCWTFNGLGGNNHSEQPGHSSQTADDRTIRFELVEDGDDSTYTLISNRFKSQHHSAILRILVDRITGHLVVCSNIAHHLNWQFSDGVVTPFGIVVGLSLEGTWMWLWKCSWSEGNVVP